MVMDSHSWRIFSRSKHFRPISIHLIFHGKDTLYWKKIIFFLTIEFHTHAKSGGWENIKFIQVLVNQILSIYIPLKYSFAKYLSIEKQKYTLLYLLIFLSLQSLIVCKTIFLFKKYNNWNLIYHSMFRYNYIYFQTITLVNFKIFSF